MVNGRCQIYTDGALACDFSGGYEFRRYYYSFYSFEAEKIIKLVEPVKNLFGAIFFVSVGMLVDPNILVEYAVPILALVAAILIGQAALKFSYSRSPRSPPSMV